MANLANIRFQLGIFVYLFPFIHSFLSFFTTRTVLCVSHSPLSISPYIFFPSPSRYFYFNINSAWFIFKENRKKLGSQCSMHSYFFLSLLPFAFFFFALSSSFGAHLRIIREGTWWWLAWHLAHNWLSPIIYSYFNCARMCHILPCWGK